MDNYNTYSGMSSDQVLTRINELKKLQSDMFKSNNVKNQNKINAIGREVQALTSYYNRTFGGAVPVQQQATQDNSPGFYADESFIKSYIAQGAEPLFDKRTGKIVGAAKTISHNNAGGTRSAGGKMPPAWS